MSYAADVAISAALDRNQVAMGEQAVLTVTVSGSGNLPTPKPPEIPNFQVYNAGRAQNFSWINGQASASVTYSYVLAPLAEGTFTIPPIRVEQDGRTVQTPETSIQVVAGNPAAASPPRGSAQPQGARSPPSPDQPAIFITGEADRKSVYVGEPVVFSFKLYNRVPLLRQPAYQPPDTQGFWSEDLPPQRNYQATIKGVPYQVTEVRTALFPTGPGTARIGSAQLRVMLENVGGDPLSTDFFARFFGRAEEKVLRTEPLSIAVRALPDPKPAGFQGAVGRYTISAAMDKTETTVGEPVTLTVTISGRGNIKALPDLALPELANFRTLADNAAVNIEKGDGEVRGSKVFKTVLIPTASGDLIVPAISYVYFDTQERAYQTMATRPFTLKVAPGSAARPHAGPAGSAADRSSPRRAGVQRLADDIRYIHTAAPDAAQATVLYRQAWVRWLHGFALLGLIALALFRLYEKFFLSDPVQVRFRTARARAMADIAKADAALERGDLRAATDLLAGALQRYLADKLRLESREPGLRQVMNAYSGAGGSAHSGEKVRKIWEGLDLLRFAPAQSRPEDVRQAHGRVSHLVDELEKETAWKA